MPRYRYINATPVVFINEVVNGKTWAPEPGEEADFDHVIDHAFLLDVTLVVDKQPPVEPPTKTDEATEQDTAVDGENLKES